MGTKSWTSSLTIWAASIVGILQMIPGIITQLDVAIPSAHLAVNPFVIQVMSIIVIIVAIYGRFTATTVLK